MAIAYSITPVVGIILLSRCFLVLTAYSFEEQSSVTVLASDVVRFEHVPFAVKAPVIVTFCGVINHSGYERSNPIFMDHPQGIELPVRSQTSVLVPLIAHPPVIFVTIGRTPVFAEGIEIIAFGFVKGSIGPLPKLKE